MRERGGGIAPAASAGGGAGWGRCPPLGQRPIHPPGYFQKEEVSGQSAGGGGEITGLGRGLTGLGGGIENVVEREIGIGGAGEGG